MLSRKKVRKVEVLFNPLNPRSDQHLISPYSNTAKPFIKRIKEMIANLRSIDLQMNSPCQYQKNHNYGEEYAEYRYWC